MNAMVRLTSAPEVVPAEEAEEYEMVDLRRDMILMWHDNRQQPSLGRTLQQLRELCYWSTMATKDGRDSVQKHMSMCEHCITRQMTDAGMGLGVDSSRRCETDISLCADERRGSTVRLCSSVEHSRCSDQVYSILCGRGPDNTRDSRMNYDRVGTLFWRAETAAVRSALGLHVGGDDVPATVGGNQRP